MTKTLIIPGLDGSPAPHWQHWWAGADPKALMVEQADWVRPQPVAWEAEVAGAILNHPGAILVGHSLGAVLITRILTKWPQLQVAGALLVAPAEPSGSTRLARFAPIPERALGVPTLVVASRNDPWMSYSRAAGLARSWGGALVDLGFAGHINVASGFGPWPQGLTLRDRLLGQVARAHEALPQRQFSEHRRLGA
ncbi:MAG: alpha/beta hydrolase [Rhodobacteraceae bacterium]|nr:alpha/beta hydrolase [Paracoccaceae bacterium]